MGEKMASMKADERRIGNLLIGVGIFIVFFGLIMAVLEGFAMQKAATGTLDCPIGECPVKSNLWAYVVLWFIGAMIAGTGFLMKRSKEISARIAETTLKVDKGFEEAKRKERQKAEFSAFLKKFSKQEVEIIEHIHTYEGIPQTELEKKTNIPKAQLDKLLKTLKDKDVIEMMPHKDTNKLYLKKFSEK